MKKILSLATLALAITLILGCKAPTTPEQTGPKEWNYQYTADTKPRTIEVSTAEDTIDWWAVTDLNNVVIASKKESDPVIEKDKSLAIELPENLFENVSKKTVLLWIHQTNNPQSFEGALTVKKDSGIKIAARDYAYARDAVGLLTITYKDLATKKWHGTYNVTTAVPLKEIDDKENKGKYNFLTNWETNVNLSDKATSKTFVWPAGTQLIGLYQPARFNPNAEGANETIEKEASTKQANWYWTQPVTLTAWDTTTVEISTNADSKAFVKNNKTPVEDPSDTAAR